MFSLSKCRNASIFLTSAATWGVSAGLLALFFSNISRLSVLFPYRGYAAVVLTAVPTVSTIGLVVLGCEKRKKREEPILERSSNYSIQCPILHPPFEPLPIPGGQNLPSNSESPLESGGDDESSSGDENDSDFQILFWEKVSSPKHVVISNYHCNHK